MIRVLHFADGNQNKSAQRIGITRGMVCNRVKQFGFLLDKKETFND